jgi:hypothetical protein
MIYRTFYVVWAPTNGPAFRRHDTMEAARDEARRLCQLNHGSEFFVMRACESVQYRTDPFVTKTFSKKG